MSISSKALISFLSFISSISSQISLAFVILSCIACLCSASSFSCDNIVSFISFCSCNNWFIVCVSIISSPLNFSSSLSISKFLFHKVSALHSSSLFNSFSILAISLFSFIISSTNSWVFFLLFSIHFSKVSDISLYFSFTGSNALLIFSVFSFSCSIILFA